MQKKMLACACETIWIPVSLLLVLDVDGFVAQISHLSLGITDDKQRSRVIDLDVDIGADAVDYK